LHARVYGGLLLLLAGVGGFITVGVWLLLIPLAKQQGSMLLPHVLGILLYSATSTLLLVTAICRRRSPRLGAKLSIVSNIVMMYPFFPMGVVVGIYGLWKVRKVDQRIGTHK